jgi:6-pyruvoyltetrahydropterin/6-carboxytetrahydropterin synthase
MDKKMKFQSTKVIELGSAAFRQWRAESHCKYIHGYRLVAKFWFGCNQLDRNNWVVDFGSLKELKNLLEESFDHTLCIAADDPHLDTFKHLHDLKLCDLRIFKDGVGIEKFTEYCFNVSDDFIRTKSNNRCWIEQVEMWEHEKNSVCVSYNLADILPSKSDPIVEYGDQVNTNNVTVPPQDDHYTQDNSPKPVQIGNKVTTGWSNPFGGTSWGV